MPYNREEYKRAIDVDYNYNLYKQLMFERAYSKNFDVSDKRIQGGIVNKAPWLYKIKALKDYLTIPSSEKEYIKLVYKIGADSY